jgi:hypothetical protein
MEDVVAFVPVQWTNGGRSSPVSPSLNLLAEWPHVVDFFPTQYSHKGRQFSYDSEVHYQNVRNNFEVRLWRSHCPSGFIPGKGDVECVLKL